jgi:hypothetical protein
MIWQEIEIEYKGKKVKVKPTIEFLNYIERRNYSIANVLERLIKQSLPSSWAVQLISDTLTYGGVKVTPEEVLEESGGFGVEVINMVTKIATCCLPQPQTPVKNAEQELKKK